jgi:phosphoenolpyruvate synthase/pyruvate phosphate dikinase
MARLGQLAADGWRVPDGYAVTADALDGWLPSAARAELERLFSASTADRDGAHEGGHEELARLSQAARRLIESQPLPAWLEDAVAEAHARLESRTSRTAPGMSAGAAAGAGPLRVAVRSSAVSEDGHAASFAGQYETYLGVSGVTEVLHHIRMCWASGYSAHALAYRRRFGGAGPLRAHDLAVGVLELVDARSAGVAFTLDPVTGDRSRLVVEGNWGFGESVVSGHVSPDHWAVDRATWRVLTERTGAKQSWAAFSAQAGRVVLEPLPAGLSAQACLSEQEVRYICQQAAALEAAEGVPQDVEWAIARDLEFPDSVFFLQHRPETTWARHATQGPPEQAPAAPGQKKAAEQAPDPAPKPAAFDPVQYALRNVFKVPGT